MVVGRPRCRLLMLAAAVYHGCARQSGYPSDYEMGGLLRRRTLESGQRGPPTPVRNVSIGQSTSR